MMNKITILVLALAALASTSFATPETKKKPIKGSCCTQVMKKSKTIATCAGSKGRCNACKNCKSCSHCGKGGGFCSVCTKTAKVSKKAGK